MYLHVSFWTEEDDAEFELVRPRNARMLFWTFAGMKSAVWFTWFRRYFVVEKRKELQIIAGPQGAAVSVTTVLKQFCNQRGQMVEKQNEDLKEVSVVLHGAAILTTQNNFSHIIHFGTGSLTYRHTDCVYWSIIAPLTPRVIALANVCNSRNIKSVENYRIRYTTCYILYDWVTAKAVNTDYLIFSVVVFRI